MDPKKAISSVLRPAGNSGSPPHNRFTRSRWTCWMLTVRPWKTSPVALSMNYRTMRFTRTRRPGTAIGSASCCARPASLAAPCTSSISMPVSKSWQARSWRRRFHPPRSRGRPAEFRRRFGAVRRKAARAARLGRCKAGEPRALACRVRAGARVSGRKRDPVRLPVNRFKAALRRPGVQLGLWLALARRSRLRSALVRASTGCSRMASTAPTMLSRSRSSFGQSVRTR